MAIATEPSCRLYAILARDGRSAVVFRRGPSKQVLVLRWWLNDDRLEAGQWLKGRIYERRCDLSPDGDLLIYFAAKWETPLSTWTAVSRTPFLTALALWPKGDAWGGGGMFMTSRIIGINHSTAEQPAMLPAAQASQAWHPLNADAKKAGTSAKPQSASLPKGYSVQRCDYDWAGRGEDNLLEHHRIMRDGWRCLEDGDRGPYSNSEFAWNFLKPEIFGKASPSGALELRRILKAIYQKNGRWYVEDFEVRTMKGAPLRSLPECSWAGWQTNGDLLFAIGGCLYRLTNDQAAVASAGVLDGAKLVADLTDLRFAQMLAPDWALTWP